MQATPHREPRVTLAARLGRRLVAIALQRCPSCLAGPVFEGLVTMRPRCSRCGHVFLREQGYFQGALYLGYGFGVLVFAAMVGLGSLVAPLELVLLVAVPVFFLLVPALWRYGRVVWMHANFFTRQKT
jgi:uncharacterized protein (DUF983 family)